MTRTPSSVLTSAKFLGSRASLSLCEPMPTSQTTAEVNMPSLPPRNTTVPNPSDLKPDDHLVPFSSPQVVTRTLQSQKPFVTERNGISSDPHEVIFLRLPKVKAVTG